MELELVEQGEHICSVDLVEESGIFIWDAYIKLFSCGCNKNKE